MLDGSVPMALGDSLLLSGIGMLVVFMELILLAFMIVIISKAVRSMTDKKSAAAAPAAPVAVAAPVSTAVAYAPATVAAAGTL
ncbi:MAG: OadG family protein, partial [Angelakisella sp.]